MSYCLNPDCQKPQNSSGEKSCQTCGTNVLLAQRYRAIKLIGAGGFGRTFMAEDEYKPSKPRCVAKQFYPSSQGTTNPDKAAELFQQEAVRLDELGKHPQIPELFAHFEQDNRLYIVQEFIDGQNLIQELAQTGSFREAQIRSILSDLLPVLELIHKEKVIHRDIKPENIIRRRSDDRLVLVDFGAAKYANSAALAKTGTTIGSAGYAAPEQSFGKAVFASDIYSLGVTCIHLLTNTEPFNLYDPFESEFVWRDYLVDNPVSDELVVVLNKMIQSSAKQRYQSAAEVMQALSLPEGTPIGNVSVPVPLPSSSTNAPSPPLQEKSSPETENQKISPIATFTDPKGAVWSVSYSPDGKKLGGGSGTIMSLFTGKDNTVRIWNIDSGKVVYTLTEHSAHVKSVAFSPDGQILASASDDKTIKLWDVSTGQKKRTLSEHSASVKSVAFSPDGQILASASHDQTIKLWDVTTGVEKNTLKEHSFWVSSVTFSPDGQTLASGSDDKTIKLWDVNTGRELRTLKGHSGNIECIAFSPDGQTLISGSGDNTIKLWDVRSDREKHTLKGHSSTVYAIAVSPDGHTVASGSGDYTIKLWDVRTGQELLTIKQDSIIYSITFSPDGQTFASGSMDKTIKIWQVPQ